MVIHLIVGPFVAGMLVSGANLQTTNQPTGCLWVVPVSACPQEFDLVKLDDDRLFLGERPAAGQDLCREDRRARALRSLPLVRRVGSAGGRE